MTFYEFNNLNEDEKAAIAMQGNFIDVRFEAGILGLPANDQFWTGADADWTARKVWKGENISPDHADDE